MAIEFSGNTLILLRKINCLRLHQTFRGKKRLIIEGGTLRCWAVTIIREVDELGSLSAWHWIYVLVEDKPRSPIMSPQKK